MLAFENLSDALEGLPIARRYEGLMFFVISEMENYRFVGGIENKHLQLVVTDISEDEDFYGLEHLKWRNPFDTLKDALRETPMSRRYRGWQCYVRETDDYYRFVDGIEDRHLILLNPQYVLQESAKLTDDEYWQSEKSVFVESYNLT